MLFFWVWREKKKHFPTASLRWLRNKESKTNSGIIGLYAKPIIDHHKLYQKVRMIPPLCVYLRSLLWTVIHTHLRKPLHFVQLKHLNLFGTKELFRPLTGIRLWSRRELCVWERGINYSLKALRHVCSQWVLTVNTLRTKLLIVMLIDWMEIGSQVFMMISIEVMNW